MIDLHEIAPEYFEAGDELELNLDHLYKQHIGHSHLAALEAVYVEGMKFVVKQIESKKYEHENERDTELQNLRDSFNDLKSKHQSLLVRVAPSSPEKMTDVDNNTQRQVINQVMGMGNNLK